MAHTQGLQGKTMLLYGMIVVWLPQLVAFACVIFTLALMLKAWRLTDNKGFLWLAIVTVMSQLYFLALKAGGMQRLAATFMTQAVVNYWFSALLAGAGVAAWRLLYKQLAAKETGGDSH